MQPSAEPSERRSKPKGLLARFWAWFDHTPPSVSDFDDYCRIKNVRFSQASIVLVAGNLLLWLPSDFWVFAGHPELVRSVVAFRLLFVTFGALCLFALTRLRASNRQTTVVLFVLYLFLCGFSFAFIGRLIQPDVPLAFTSVAAPIVLVSLLLPLTQRALLVGSGIFVIIASYYSTHPIEQTFRYNGMAWLFLCVVGLCVIAVGHMLYRLEKSNFYQRLSIREHAVRLEELDRMKDAFVTTVSHELRTPLNAIIGLTDVVLDEELPAEVRQHVRTIHDSGDVLLHLINDILDLAKIRSGKLELEETPMSVRSLVETTAGFFAVACEQKGLTLAYHVPADLPLVHADPGRLGQVLLNLLGNAVKFTDSGEITVEVSWERRGDRAALQFLVRDTGPGIPAQSKKLVFEEFTQAEPGTTRRYGGTGLGLPIVRRLVRLMGGDIRVEDNAPVGSTFVVDVSLKLTASADPLMRPIPATAGATWIVCAPHTVRRRHAVETLRRIGATPREVATLADAEKALASLLIRPGPIAILVDNAELTAEQLERSGLWAVRPPDVPVVVVLGARMLQREGRTFRTLGVRHVLQAPIRTPDLLDVVKLAAGAATPLPLTPASPQPPTMVDGPRRRLLVVDDVKENRQLIGALLKNLPIDIEFADNGVVGVERFVSGTFDAVLLDIEMPKLDGYGAVRRMRNWELETDHPATPIIALTAHGAPEHRARAAEAGFTAHVTKPIHKRTLLEVLAPWLHIETSPAPAQASPAGLPGKALLSGWTDLQTKPSLAPSHLTPAPVSEPKSVLAGPSPEVQQLRPVFLSKVREDLLLLEEWLRRGELEPMARLGHRLAGSGGSFGFQTISQVGEKLEAAASSGNVAAVVDLVEALRAELDTAA